MSNKIARGGTELIADRINNTVDPDLLSKVQIIHSRVRELEDKPRILVLHDLAGDPEVAHLANGGWQKFDKLVFVSHWQQQQYHDFLGVPFSAGTVIHNGIEPMELHEKPTDGVIRLVYFSTPHRGLEILYPVFDAIRKNYPDIPLELKVFSSYDLYGWDERDAAYKQLFDKLEEHPDIVYSKSVDNATIREELKSCHILAYPSIWQETSCLCLIEAMAAGLVCVHSSLAALPETSMNLTWQYMFTEDIQEHAERFYRNLTSAIIAVANGQSVRSGIVQHVNNVYNWDSKKHQWESLIQEVLTNH